MKKIIYAIRLLCGLLISSFPSGTLKADNDRARAAFADVVNTMPSIDKFEIYVRYHEEIHPGYLTDTDRDIVIATLKSKAPTFTLFYVRQADLFSMEYRNDSKPGYSDAFEYWDGNVSCEYYRAANELEVRNSPGHYLPGIVYRKNLNMGVEISKEMHSNASIEGASVSENSTEDTIIFTVDCPDGYSYKASFYKLAGGSHILEYCSTMSPGGDGVFYFENRFKRPPKKDDELMELWEGCLNVLYHNQIKSTVSGLYSCRVIPSNDLSSSGSSFFDGYKKWGSVQVSDYRLGKCIYYRSSEGPLSMDALKAKGLLE